MNYFATTESMNLLYWAIMRYNKHIAFLEGVVSALKDTHPNLAQSLEKEITGGYLSSLESDLDSLQELLGKETPCAL